MEWGCGIVYILNVCLHSDIDIGSISLTLQFLDQLSETGMLFLCANSKGKFSTFEATKPMKLVLEILDMFSMLRLHVNR